MKKNGSQVRSNNGPRPPPKGVNKNKGKNFPRSTKLSLHIRLYFQGEIIHQHINRTLATLKNISTDQIKTFRKHHLGSGDSNYKFKIIELQFPESNSEQMRCASIKMVKSYHIWHNVIRTKGPYSFPLGNW